MKLIKADNYQTWYIENNNKSILIDPWLSNKLQPENSFFIQRNKDNITVLNQEQIEKGWDKTFQDRKNELVIIGIELDKEKIKSELDACLLTDEELADESWKKESSDSWPVHRLESDVDLNHNHIPMTNDGKKVGRNDKIKLISPEGNEVVVKFKKIESYLSKGYKLASQTTA